MSLKRFALGGALLALGLWAVFAWSLTGAFLAHVFTGG
jgi:hypothetical protein